MKNIVIAGFILLIGAILTWYFGMLGENVETIDELIGQNYDYAHKFYFETGPDDHYLINVNDELNEFDGGILNKKDVLTDSMVHVYTWNFFNHKKTIWTGKTKKMNDEVIDAIRYTNDVQF